MTVVSSFAQVADMRVNPPDHTSDAGSCCGVVCTHHSTQGCGGGGAAAVHLRNVWQLAADDLRSSDSTSNGSGGSTGRNDLGLCLVHSVAARNV